MSLTLAIYKQDYLYNLQGLVQNDTCGVSFTKPEYFNMAIAEC